ncbi:MAG: M20/M25/M40 family metallo-hydrolase [Actinomycetes bacterium]
MADERLIAERLIACDSSRPEGIEEAAGFVGGWLASKGVQVERSEHGGLPVLIADAGTGGPEIPKVVFHGHLDVVPGQAAQFSPVLDGDRLIGRGAYDMKGGLAAMLCAVGDLAEDPSARIRMVIVPDEEAEELDERATDVFVASGQLDCDFAITGEPTELHVGVEAKGVLLLDLEVSGKSAHGATPWLGENAALRGIDVFRAIESLPFARASSETFDRPSINLGRISAGDAPNRVPDLCRLSVDIRFLPGQDPEDIKDAVRALDGVTLVRSFERPPAWVSKSDPFVVALRESAARAIGGEALSVGRDGASDAIAFLQAGIPAVEFGPVGGGHHGPEEWVSVQSLTAMRSALGSFIRALPSSVGAQAQRSAQSGEVAK